MYIHLVSVPEINPMPKSDNRPGCKNYQKYIEKRVKYLSNYKRLNINQIT